MGPNSVCHIEISCTDSGKAAKFYGGLFGWKIDNAMGDEYIFFQPEIGVGGAFSKNEKHAPGASVIFYVEVDDIEAYLKKAVELGGQESTPKTEIPGHGWYGHFIDPDGNLMGLFTAQNPA
jgi:predicted enzyme related to lactoylglutathione lyase